MAEVESNHRPLDRQAGALTIRPPLTFPSLPTVSCRHWWHQGVTLGSLYKVRQRGQPTVLKIIALCKFLQLCLVNVKLLNYSMLGDAFIA